MSTATRLHEREPQTIARDAAYVAAAFADDAYSSISSLVERIEQIRAETPAKARELRETGPQRLRTLPEDAQQRVEERRTKVESQLQDLRDRAQHDADERLARFEASFDAKAAEGADRVAAVREDERVSRVTTAFEPVGGQLKTARSQVKGAITSVRKTFDAAFEAGRAQADTARSQVKAAATSTFKTVDVVVDAGRSLAS